MDAITLDDLHALVSSHASPCISLYMPTHAFGRESEQDPLNFMRMVDQLQQQLVEQWISGAEAQDLLVPLRELVLDTAFWQQRSDALAVFLSRDLFRRYRLPVNFAASTTVKPRFAIRPLLPLVTEDDHFLLLTLSQRGVRLYEGDALAITPRGVPKLPTNLKSILEMDAADQLSKQLLMASADSTSPDLMASYDRQCMRNARRTEIVNYFRSVDAALHPHLQDQKIPLLIAGVPYLIPLYREVNRYTHLASQHLEASSDYLPDFVLHKLAWQIMRQIFTQQRQWQIERILRSASGTPCLTDILTLLPEAAAGSVDSLLLAQDAQLYGTFDPATGELNIDCDGRPESEDLLDLAATETLRHRGNLFSLPRDAMPHGSSIAAVLRN
jgi:hypothetical protein